MEKRSDRWEGHTSFQMSCFEYLIILTQTTGAEEIVYINHVRIQDWWTFGRSSLRRCAVEEKTTEALIPPGIRVAVSKP